MEDFSCAKICKICSKVDTNTCLNCVVGILHTSVLFDPSGLPPCVFCRNFFGACQLSAGQQLHCINNQWSNYTNKEEEKCTCPISSGYMEEKNCRKCGKVAKRPFTSVPNLNKQP